MRKDILEVLQNAKNVGCVGKRNVPGVEMFVCSSIGRFLTILGKRIHTGNATGCDFAFACGANYAHPELVNLYLADRNHNRYHIVKGNVVNSDQPEEWKEIAKKYHGGYDKMTPYVQKLFNRNAGIVLNSEILIAYPDVNKPGGGGTGHDIRIANGLGIPVIDLSKKDEYALIIAYFCEVVPEDEDDDDEDENE